MAVHYLVPDGKHLPVSGEDGKPDHRLMGAAWAALHGGYRGNKYEGDGKAEAIAKLKALYKAEGMEPPSENESEVRDQQSEARLATSDSRLPRFVYPIRLDESSKAVRIGLAVTGKWVKQGEEFEITQDDLVLAAENFRKKLTGEINVDYDHASEMPEVAAGGPVPSAGRIVSVEGPEKYEVTGDRGQVTGKTQHPAPSSQHRFILWGSYEPTPRARQMIQNGEYRWISPAINWGARDKQTGKRQGTTFTSVALTNRPFLEELPQIHLSDPDFIDLTSKKLETRNWKLETSRQFPVSNFQFLSSEGGTVKKLSMAKCDDGAGIFDGNEPLGFVPHADVKKYHQDHLEPDSGETASEAARAATAAGVLSKIYLSEKPDEDAADHLLSEGACTLTELRRAERARKAVDAAMAAGKILPVDRRVAFSTAFRDPRAFEEWISKRPAYARLTAPAGVAGPGFEGQNARVQLAELVRVKQDELRKQKPEASHPQLFREATELVRKENPELFRRYREEK